jgi:hypothetical protein
MVYKASINLRMGAKVNKDGHLKTYLDDCEFSINTVSLQFTRINNELVRNFLPVINRLAKDRLEKVRMRSESVDRFRFFCITGAVSDIRGRSAAGTHKSPNEYADERGTIRSLLSQLWTDRTGGICRIDYSVKTSRKCVRNFATRCVGIFYR